MESELKLCYSQIDKLHSTDSVKEKKTKSTSTSTSTWKITDSDLIELARSLYSANISFTNGKKTKFIEIVKDLESFFGIKVKRPHNKVTRISERVNVSPFLDMLKDSYIRDLESRL